MRGGTMAGMDENPYKSPETMNTSGTPLADKARRLLVMRRSGISVSLYVRQIRVHHVLSLTICIASILLLVAIAQHSAALFVGGVLLGRVLSEIRWYRSIAREWKTTEQLIDWEKVESLATQI
jgi:hypothetical protein